MRFPTGLANGNALAIFTAVRRPHHQGSSRFEPLKFRRMPSLDRMSDRLLLELWEPGFCLVV